MRWHDPTLKRIDVVTAIFIAGAMLGACAAEMKNDLAVRSGNDSFALIANTREPAATLVPRRIERSRRSSKFRHAHRDQVSVVFNATLSERPENLPRERFCSTTRF